MNINLILKKNKKSKRITSIKFQNKIFECCKKHKVPFGFHVIDPEGKIIEEKLNHGATFIAVGADTVFLNKYSKLNKIL